MDHVQDYSFVIECTDDSCPGWTHPGRYLIIGVHKFVSVDAATNALMHAMRSFATDTLAIPIDGKELQGIVSGPMGTWYTLDQHPEGFAIVQHTPGADGWILRGTPTETTLIVGRAVLTLHVRPENTSNDNTDSLEKSLVIANAEKISLVQDLNEVRAQLRELSDAFYKLIGNNHAHQSVQSTVQSSVQSSVQPSVQPPPRIVPSIPVPPPLPAVPPTDALVAELSAFDRSNLLSRSQRDRKLRAKMEIPVKYDIVYGCDGVDDGDDNDNVDEVNDAGDDVGIVVQDGIVDNGGEYDSEEFFGDYVNVDNQEEMLADIPDCCQDEILSYQSLELAQADFESWDNQSIGWIDDRVCSPRVSPAGTPSGSPIGTPSGSPKSSPISTPVRSPVCSFDNGGELLWQRRYIPADVEGIVDNLSTSPRLPYPWSAPGYMKNVAFSDSTIRSARGILMRSPKYE